jgi:hypothetical protein
MGVNGCIATAICVASLSIGIAGCGLIRQQEIKERNAALKQQSEAATQECDAKFPPGNPKTAVTRVKRKLMHIKSCAQL